MIREKFEKRFEAVPESGCWIWTAGGNRLGYGNFRVGKEGDILAHRWAWRLYRGQIPAGSHVLHSCDVRCCVNPDHLFLGSNADNIADRVKKGRSAKTNRRPSGLRYKPMSAEARENRRRHSEDQRAEAKRLVARGGMSQRRIAETLGVSQAWVSNVSRGKY